MVKAYFRARALDILVRVAPIAGGRASTAPSTTVLIGTNGARQLYEVGTINELRTGQDPNGSEPDAVITVDPSYLTNELWLSSDPLAAVPANKTDGFTAFLHEMGHALGIIGLRDVATAALGPDETTFDKLTAISADGTPTFVGKAAVAINDGPVGLTAIENSGQNYFHFGNSLDEPLGRDLMNGVALFRGTRYGISGLDLAVVQDLGLSILAPATPPVINLDRSPVALSEANAGVTAFSFIVNWSVTSPFPPRPAMRWPVRARRQPTQPISAAHCQKVQSPSRPER